MNLVYLVHVGAFLLATLGSFWSLLLANRIAHPDTRNGMMGLLVTSGVWAGAQAAYLLVPWVPVKQGLQIVGLVAGIIAVVAWLYFAAAYSGRSPHALPYRRTFLGAIGGLILIKITNPLHNLYFSTAAATEPFAHLAVQYGILHWLAMGFAYAVSFVGFYMIIERFAQTDVSTRPLEGLVALTALPIAVDILGVRTDWALGLTYEPIGVAAFALGTLVVYFQRFQQVRLVSDVDEPVLFLDTESRISSFNRRARELFPELEGARGEALDSVLPDIAAALGGEGDTITRREGDETRYYRISSSPFQVGETQTGRMVIVADITDTERHRQDLERTTEQLSVLNRMVRHDIRNDMAVIIGWGEMLEEHVDESGRESLERMLDTASDVVDLTEQSRAFIEALATDEELELEPIPLQEYLSKEVEKQRRSHPDADIEIEDPLPSVSVQANEMLSSVFRNVIENAIENNDEETAAVRIRTTTTAESVVVRIADNGPGIPDDRKESVFGRGEKGLDSEGTGIGLYLVQTLVDQFGGRVWIEDNEPKGAIFVLELPRAGDE